jgi:hypothetical protein
MARHKRAYTGERRTAALRLQLTPAERSHLDAAAEAHGMSLSDYARRAVFRRPVQPRKGRMRQNPDAVALWEQVRALGVNLNQIAHHAHATGEIRDIPELRELCQEIRAVFERIVAL